MMFWLSDIKEQFVIRYATIQTKSTEKNDYKNNYNVDKIKSIINWMVLGQYFLLPACQNTLSWMQKNYLDFYHPKNLNGFLLK